MPGPRHTRPARPGDTVTAALGPTNTGKTHAAIQRMLEHRTGLIGLPLRLLAREVYDRLVAEVGADAVSLLTGEERIAPPGARYCVATVESMPVSRSFDFVAVDEIQLCTHPTRGHVFTDRLLHARGTAETWFMGADTMAPLLSRLLPRATIERRPRLSTLRYRGSHKLSRLPRRSAVVAFGVPQVYELAERLRSRHGGTAVVLGALSPRTRNAQVALFQSGEVPCMVATDAIGMGLNLDLDHVALAGLEKFDGTERRPLHPDEIGQIAGRAGRHTRDGTFGTTAECPPLPAHVVEQVESHDFPAVRRLMWRNSDLDFHGPQALLDSLQRPPPDPRFVRYHQGLDEQALSALARREHIRRSVRGVDDTRRLWRICQIPDFRNSLTESHVALLAWLWEQVGTGDARLTSAEVHAKVRPLDRTDGDIETLMGRLAWMRTWTFIAHRSEWVEDAAGWQGRTLQAEARISDALHARLTERFVDRRSAMVGALAGERARHPPEVDEEGVVRVLDTVVGEVRGFSFVPEPRGMPADEPHFERTVRRLVAPSARTRAEAMLAAEDDALSVDGRGRILWEEVALGLLEKGEDLYRPRVRALRHDLLDDDLRERVEARLAAFRAHLVGRVDGPLSQAPADRLDRPGRGVHYQVRQGLGSAPADALRPLIRELSDADRKNLARLGIRLGRHHAYTQGLLSPAAVQARAALWQAHTESKLPVDLPHASSHPREAGVDDETWRALGYARLGPRVVRQDMLERVAAWVRKAGRGGGFPVNSPPLEWLGAPKDEAPALYRALGCRPADRTGERWVLARQEGERRRRRSRRRGRTGGGTRSDREW